MALMLTPQEEAQPSKTAAPTTPEEERVRDEIEAKALAATQAWRDFVESGLPDEAMPHPGM